MGLGDAIAKFKKLVEKQSEDASRLQNIAPSRMADAAKEASGFYSNEAQSLVPSTAADPDLVLKESSDMVDSYIGDVSVDDAASHVDAVGKASVLRFLSNPKGVLGSITSLAGGLSSDSTNVDGQMDELSNALNDLDTTINSVNRANIDQYDTQQYDQALKDMEVVDEKHAVFAEKAQQGVIDPVAKKDLDDAIDNVISGFTGNTGDAMEQSRAIRRVEDAIANLEGSVPQYLEDKDSLGAASGKAASSTYQNQISTYPNMTGDSIDKAKSLMETGSQEQSKFQQIQMSSQITSRLAAVRAAVNKNPDEIQTDVAADADFAAVDSLSNSVQAAPVTDTTALVDELADIKNLAQRSLVIDMSGGVFASKAAPYQARITSSRNEISAIKGTIDSSSVVDSLDIAEKSEISNLLSDSALDSLSSLYRSGAFDKIGAISQFEATTYGELGEEIRKLIESEDLRNTNQELWIRLLSCLEKLDALEKNSVVAAAIALSETPFSAGLNTGRSKLLAEIALCAEDLERLTS
jgi:hypothetical protein